ncbi:MAG: type II secretion system protein GspG [Planctomycetota bacterium]|jgi:general secretion pathway protein G
MTTSRAGSCTAGFTLVEVLVVLAVLGVLAGMATPLVSALVDAQRRDEARLDLAQINEALENYYFDKGSLPASLTASDFYAVYLQPGVNGRSIEDPWGQNQSYIYQTTSSPDVANIHSRGENGSDDGFNNEEHRISFYGSIPGAKRTRMRMRVITEVMANYLEAGGALSGSWPADRAAMGLGAEYANDGYGSAFTLDAANYVLRSAGPDRVMGNGDDLSS